MKHISHSISSFCYRLKPTHSLKTTNCYSFVLLLFLFSSITSFSQNALVPFTFKLTVSAKTSAGVFKKDGTLIRTLWGGVTYPAGTHTKTWDRKDDDGYLVADTGLVVKVLSNNVNYQWDGAFIGNTSDSAVGYSKIHGFQRMTSMAVNNDTAYYAIGYSEAATAAHKLDFKHPQNKTDILQDYNTSQATDFVATDGHYVYWAGLDPLNPTTSFVYASKVSDDDEAIFSNGVAVPTQWGRTYKSGIDVIYNNLTGLSSGLAVQKYGNYLFVSHKTINEVHVLDKITGALVQIISINSPRHMCVDMNDNLWMISGTNTLNKYSVDSTGLLSSPILSISGLMDPLAIAISPNNYQILVSDGGLSQQVKAFKNNNGDSLWTLGQLGGYESDPSVTNDKFYFSDTVSIHGSFIVFQSDSSFWIEDKGNERLQHYSSSLSFIDRIMSLPHSYSVYADRNDPTRVFNEYLEFKIDYSKPLASNNGSWTLVKNWRHGIPAGCYMDFIANIFKEVITLSNGRTYATIENLSIVKGYRFPEIVELPASGHVRFTGIRFGYPSYGEVIATDGSRRRLVTTHALDTTGHWEYKQLTGFDTSNNPLWTAVDTIALLPKIKANDPAYNDMANAEGTSSGIMVIFNAQKDAHGYHLGGVKVGDSKYLWKTAMSTPVGYNGPFPTDGGFDVGNGVVYAGGQVYAVDKNIFWNYHGEFWKGGQTNIWNHVYDNGLLVAQFGKLNRFSDFNQSGTMCAGNVFAATVVKVGNDYYIYHNDESVHGGVHRWKVTGLNTIMIDTIPITFSTVSGGLTGVYFNGSDLNNVNRKVTQIDTNINLKNPPPQISNSSNFSARWTGYVTPKYSENYTFYTNTNKGVKLWVDNNLVINQWKNNSRKEYYYATTVKLEAGKIYSVRMDVSGGNASLSWSSKTQNKQIIPSANLYPSEFPDNGQGLELMEGLPFKEILENGLYGWNRNPIYENQKNSDEFWHAESGIFSTEKNSPDVSIRFKRNRNDTNYYVSRDLGMPNPCLVSWKVEGKMCLQGNYASWDKLGGMSIDILDDQGKKISTITHEVQLTTGNNQTQIKCNGTAIIDKPTRVIDEITSMKQPFEVYADSMGVVFSYANLTPINIKVFDKNCHWNKPTTVKINFNGGLSNVDRTISLEKMKFIAVIGLSALPIKEEDLTDQNTNKVDSNKTDFNLNVYPNPFNQSVKLNFNNIDRSEYANVKMYAIDGKKVFENQYAIDRKMNTLILDTDILTTGMYYISLQVGDKQQTKIIQKY